jgi:hypothetical protein
MNYNPNKTMNCQSEVACNWMLKKIMKTFEGCLRARQLEVMMPKLLAVGISSTALELAHTG